MISAWKYYKAGGAARSRRVSTRPPSRRAAALGHRDVLLAARNAMLRRWYGNRASRLWGREDWGRALAMELGGRDIASARSCPETAVHPAGRPAHSPNSCAPERQGRGARLDGDLVWFCVPDREIARAARQLADAADWQGKVALHSSGALASDELRGLRLRGAAVASVHPLMTFVLGSVPSLKGVPFAFEGDPAAVRVAGTESYGTWVQRRSPFPRTGRWLTTPGARLPRRS